MALTPSHRPTREWPLLLLTLAIVGVICVPLYQGLSGPDGSSSLIPNWTAERWGRLLIGPEQIACYCCFVWASLILVSRYLEIRRQRKAFRLPFLPTEQGIRILYDDARPLQRRVEQFNQDKGPFILATMIRQALSKYILSRSTKDVSEAVRTQADADLGRFVTTMATVRYLAWALPALGFLGTVRGLASGLSMASNLATAGPQANDATDVFLLEATKPLDVAFDTTLIALLLSLVVMFFLHMVQKDEESLVIDCQQYCTEHLVNRLYEPEPLGTEADGTPYYPQELNSAPITVANRGPSRLTP